MPRKILCIDIGGSKILTGIVDETGKVLTKRKRLFDHPDKQQVVDAILQESEAVLSENSWRETPAEEISCIGASIPGLTDSKAGLWVYAPFSKIENLNVRELLESRFHKPAFLENDGNICAIGEKRFGHTRDVDDFLWVTVSNGVGAGLVLNGRLYEGAFKGAGELGHVKVVDHGAPCPCGGRGCLETYAAAPGIVRRYQELTGSGESITALAVSELARSGDAAALQIFQDEGFYLGKAIAGAVNVLNLPMVVIGGGVSGSFDLFAPSLHKTLEEFLFLDANRQLRVVPTALGYEASLISAGACALYGMEAREHSI